MNTPDYSVARTVTLTVEVPEGVPLPVAARHAAILANHVGFWVRFWYSKVDCYVAPHCRPDDLLAEFDRAMAHTGSLERPPAIARAGGNHRWQP